MALFTELWTTITGLTFDNTWRTVDLTSFGVPDSAVVMIHMSAAEASATTVVGVRVVGSSYTRVSNLHEAESGGYTAVAFCVQADSSAQIQYIGNSSTCVFRVAGYFESGVSYTEKYDDIDSGSAGSWNDSAEISGGAGRVGEFLCENYSTSSNYLQGVRNNGSSYNRYIDLHEAEGTAGGAQAFTTYATIDASGYVETWQGSTSNANVCLGYFSSNVLLAEVSPTIHDISESATWQNFTISGAPDGAAIVAVAKNYDGNSEWNQGARSYGSSLSRYYSEHESETNGYATSTFLATCNSSGTIQVYSGTSVDGFFEVSCYLYTSGVDTHKFPFNVIGESTTASAAAAVLRKITPASTGESNTASSIASVLRPLPYSVAGESLTATASMLLQCAFAYSVIGESLTSAPILNVLRNLSHSVVGESLAGDTAILSILRSCLLSSTGESLTSSATLIFLIKFILASIGESLTSTAIMDLVRSFVPVVVGESVTSNPPMLNLCSLTFSSYGESLTGDVATNVVRVLPWSSIGESVTGTAALSNLLSIAFSTTGESLTGSPILSILRSLAWAAIGESLTANADLTVTGGQTLLFLFNAIGESLLASSALNVLRSIAHVSGGESLTADSILNVFRPLAWNVIGESLTSDATMALVRGFSWLTTGESLTATATLLNLLSQTLNSSGESLTTSAILETLRKLIWLSTGESLTADAELVLAAILNQYSFRFINDDGIENASTFRDSLNTNISILPGNIIRLRFLLDTTGDVEGKQFQIEYRRKPSGGSFGDWKKIV